MNINKKALVHPYLDSFVAIFLLFIFFGTVFLLLSIRVTDIAKETQAKEASLTKARIRAFNQLMESRSVFLTINAQDDTTLAQAKTKIDASLVAKAAWHEEWDGRQAGYTEEVAAVKAHNDAEQAKFREDPRYINMDIWTFPSFPPLPADISVDFSPEISQLMVELQELDEYINELKDARNRNADEEVGLRYTSLLKSAETYRTAFSDDIDLIKNILINGEEGVFVNETKAGLIKYSAGDEGIKALNKIVLVFIEKYSLEKADYEVSGGADSNPNDKSDL
jgi:hypothetical protein